MLGNFFVWPSIVGLGHVLGLWPDWACPGRSGSVPYKRVGSRVRLAIWPYEIKITGVRSADKLIIKKARLAPLSIVSRLLTQQASTQPAKQSYCEHVIRSYWEQQNCNYMLCSVQLVYNYWDERNIYWSEFWALLILLTLTLQFCLLCPNW